MKNKRQARIIELIIEKSIETQEELSDILRSEGFMVTQATVSRDIRELKLVKTVSSEGKFRYSHGKESSGKGNVKQSDILSTAVVSVDSAGNITVVKTITGMASGAAAAIDLMHHEKIVGSVAGDDTIIIVTRSEASAMSLREIIAKDSSLTLR